MTHVLTLNASAMSEGSKTRDGVAKVLAALSPTKVTDRDLRTPLPFVTEDWAKARLVPADDRTEDQRTVLALSDALIAELRGADTIVLGIPVYNFGVPASLKAWFDLVARPKETFAYTENGPIGLLEGKKAIIVMASGGTAIEGPADFATPWLKFALNFIGISDVTVIDAKAPDAFDSVSKTAA